MEGIIKYCYPISAIFFLAFIANIIVGKVSIAVFDRQLPLTLNEISEFLLLFFACTFFVIGILRSEANSDSSSNSKPI